MTSRREKTTMKLPSIERGISETREKTPPRPHTASGSLLRVVGEIDLDRLEELGFGEVADILDLWALRREKVLAILDPRAARRARDLAIACRQLEHTISVATPDQRGTLA